MATTYNTPFITKPDAGLRLGDMRAMWDALVNQNAVSTAYGIAGAGTTQATATVLTSVFNQVDTTAASTGVCLPSSKGNRATPYQICIIFNNGANALTVYAAVPASGTADTINGTAGATGVSLPANAVATYFSAKPGVWFSDIGTAASFGALTATTFNGNTITVGTDTVAMLAAINAFTGANTSSDNLTFSTAAKGPVLKRGSNGKVGQFTLAGTAAVTVSNTSIQTSDAIIISLSVVGGTVGAFPTIKTITAATGFTVAGTAADTSTYNYAVISNAN